MHQPLTGVCVVLPFASENTLWGWERAYLGNGGTSKQPLVGNGVSRAIRIAPVAEGSTNAPAQPSISVVCLILYELLELLVCIQKFSIVEIDWTDIY